MSNSPKKKQQEPPTTKRFRKRTILNGHRVPVCVTGKLRYRDRTQAQAALTASRWAGDAARAHGEQTRRNETRVYRCFCGGWHATSQPKRSAAAA